MLELIIAYLLSLAEQLNNHLITHVIPTQSYLQSPTKSAVETVSIR